MVSPKLLGTALLTGAAIACAIPAPTALAEGNQPEERLGLVNLTIHDHAAKTFRTALLACGLNTGSHPDPEAACGAIANAEGDIDAIEDDDGMCPLIYAPATVRATGFFAGKPVEYSETFANACVAANATAGVFDF